MPAAPRALGLDVSLVWGDNVLAVRRVEGGKVSFADVGPIPLPPGAGPDEPFACVWRDGASFLAPAGVLATVERADGTTSTTSGSELADGDRAEIPIGALSVRLAVTAREPEVARRRTPPGAVVAAVLASALSHGLLLHHASRCPSAPAQDAERDLVASLRSMLARAEPPSPETEPSPRAPSARRGPPEDDAPPEPWRGPRDPFAKSRDERRASAAASSSDAETSARGRVLRDAGSFGLAGLLAAWGPPPAPFMAPEPNSDPAMWSDPLGGAGGVGFGSDVRGGFIEAGPLSVAGFPAPSVAFGFAHPRERAAPSRTPARVDAAGLAANDMAAAQRVVGQNLGRLRLCYTSGLRTNPTLTGRVTVRFEVGPEGSVVHAADAGSSSSMLPEVSACVVRAVAGLAFARPAGGRVAITYPIDFSPT